MTILLQAKLWITPRDVIDVKMRRKNFLRRIFDYFHLKRVMAKLQHMCLCECDHPLQIKTIREPILSQANRFINLSGRWESNQVCTNPNRAYYRYTTARLLCLTLIYKGFSVNCARPKLSQGLLMLPRTIALVLVPAVLRKPRVKLSHNSISLYFCNNGGRGDGERERVAVNNTGLCHFKALNCEVWDAKPAIHQQMHSC